MNCPKTILFPYAVLQFNIIAIIDVDKQTKVLLKKSPWDWNVSTSKNKFMAATKLPWNRS